MRTGLDLVQIEMTLERRLAQVPYSINTRIPPKFPAYFISRAATSFSLNGEQPTVVVGDGCNLNKELAEMSAVGEMHEHLWTLLASTASLMELNKSIKFTVLTQKGWCHLKSATGHYAMHLSRELGCSEGYAFHHSESSALNHALFEFTERRLTTETWYGRRKLLSYARSDGNGLNFYTLIDPTVPYCLVALLGEQFLSLGSKASHSYESSVAGATSEAVMIFDAYGDPQKSSRPPDRHSVTVDRLRKKQFRMSTLKTLLAPTVPINQCNFERFKAQSPVFSPYILFNNGLSNDDIIAAYMPCPIGFCISVYLDICRKLTLRPNPVAYSIPML